MFLYLGVPRFFSKNKCSGVCDGVTSPIQSLTLGFMVLDCLTWDSGSKQGWSNYAVRRGRVPGGHWSSSWPYLPPTVMAFFYLSLLLFLRRWAKAAATAITTAFPWGGWNAQAHFPLTGVAAAMEYAIKDIQEYVIPAMVSNTIFSWAEHGSQISGLNCPWHEWVSICHNLKKATLVESIDLLR